MMIKPKRLEPGNTIAVVSPSSGAAAAFPHILDEGMRVLTHEFGLRVKEYPTARMDEEKLHDHPDWRARDINDAFCDPEVDGIIATIGGDDSVRILEYLDLELIRRHPKLLMGYSDTTTLLAYLNLHGMVTFYGPSVMAGFGYLRNFPEAVGEYRQFLFSDGKVALRPFGAWGDQYRDWNQPGNAGCMKEVLNRHTEYRWINQGAVSRGRPWGGCIEVLEMMNGTFAWPGGDFWNERILFVETSEDKPTPAQVGCILRNYGIQGILRRIQGLLVARPKDYSLEEKAELDREVLRIVIGEFGREDLNIVTNIEFGHTDPRHIIPYGVEMEIDPLHEEIKVVESPFA